MFERLHSEKHDDDDLAKQGNKIIVLWSGIIEKASVLKARFCVVLGNASATGHASKLVKFLNFPEQAFHRVMSLQLLDGIFD